MAEWPGFKQLYQRIGEHNPIDLIGFQDLKAFTAWEGCGKECNDINKVLIGSNLTHFDFFAPAGDAPMAWDATRFQRVGDGASVGVAEDKYGTRVVNYVRLREQKSGETIFFANTHGPLGQCAGDKGLQMAQNYLQAGGVVAYTSLGKKLKLLK